VSYDSTVLADSPYAYWPCGDTSGTTLADATGNGRAMTLSGAYTLNQAGIPGDVGGGSVLWSGGHAVWAETANSTDCALEAWVWLPPAVTAEVIIFCNQPIAVFIELAAGVAHLYPNGGGLAGGGAINDSAWHHVVGVRSASGSNGYTAGSSYLFVDGVQVNSETGTGTGGFGTLGTWEVGAYNGAYNFTTGRTAKVALWHSTPSAATIAAHYAAGATPATSGSAVTGSATAGPATASATITATAPPVATVTGSATAGPCSASAALTATAPTGSSFTATATAGPCSASAALTTGPGPSSFTGSAAAGPCSASAYLAAAIGAPATTGRPGWFPGLARPATHHHRLFHR
jgi:hypothetical protein